MPSSTKFHTTSTMSTATIAAYNAFDGDGDMLLTIDRDDTDASAWLAKDDVRALRDHLSSVLGDEAETEDAPAEETDALDAEQFARLVALTAAGRIVGAPAGPHVLLPLAEYVMGSGATTAEAAEAEPLTEYTAALESGEHVGITPGLTDSDAVFVVAAGVNMTPDEARAYADALYAVAAHVEG